MILTLVRNRILPDVELSRYVRNKLVMPRFVAENITRLSKWQEQFDYQYQEEHPGKGDRHGVVFLLGDMLIF